MADAMEGRGASAASVPIADVLARAGVSNAAFHQEFGDLDAALLAAFELGVERARKAVVPAYEAERRWLDAIRAGLAAFLGFVESEPALARLAIVHAMGGAPGLLRRRAEVLSSVARAIDEGRAESGASRHPPPAIVAEGVVGAVLAVLQNRMLSAEDRPPRELFGSLAGIIVLPYLGASVARRELVRPAPPPRSLGPVPGGERAGPVGAASMKRLTYRTARVLRAIGDYPGASNREVAERAGVVDQGQISKLLGRLEAQGLIEKIGEARTRGAPNSWALTKRGESLTKSVEGQL
jgi:AcrR family transcriptional regulator